MLNPYTFQTTTTDDTYRSLCALLERYLNPISARSVLRAAMTRAGLTETALSRASVQGPFIQAIEQRLGSYNLSRPRCAELLQSLRQLGAAAATQAGAATQRAGEPELIRIKDEADIVVARRAARELSNTLGFAHTAQIKITTAVSELARNIYKYAGQGMIQLTTLDAPSSGMRIEAIDQGPGIPHLDQILSGTYQSKTGMGLGIWGCKNLMDTFSINSAAGAGTQISMEIFL